MNKIQKVNNLHDKAMELAESGYLEQRKNSHELSDSFFQRSYELEKEAAMMLVSEYEIEPTRSVLFKGAACLAINAGMLREAERMIGFALSGNPPASIAEELRALLIEINEEKIIHLKEEYLKEQMLSNRFKKLPADFQQMVEEFVDFLLEKRSKRA